MSERSRRDGEVSVPGLEEAPEEPGAGAAACGSFATIDEDRPLRAVIVGAGFIGPMWAPELLSHPGTELAGWVDLDEGRARAAAARLGLDGLPVGGSLTSMIDRVEPDFIVNCTVPEAHHEVTVTALDRGVAVLSEKPLAVGIAEARAMVEAADRAKRLFAVSQNRRHMPGLVAFRRTVAGLGALGLLSSAFHMPYHGRPFLDALEHPLLQDMAIHLFDAARAVSGADPVSVYCESFRPEWSGYAGACSATAVIEINRGQRYVLTGSRSAPGFPTSWTGSWQASGARGTARWNGERTVTVDPAEGETLSVHAPRPDPFRRSRFTGLAEGLEEFVTALRTGRPPQGECHDNLLSFAMVTSAVESARTGTRVPIGM